MIANNGLVKAAELSERSHISHVSIRRDRVRREQLGVSKRVQGGAVTLRQAPMGSYLAAARSHHFEKEECIGRMATALICEDNRIIRDSGTTPCMWPAAFGRTCLTAAT